MNEIKRTLGRKIFYGKTAKRNIINGCVAAYTVEWTRLVAKLMSGYARHTSREAFIIYRDSRPARSTVAVTFS